MKEHNHKEHSAQEKYIEFQILSEQLNQLNQQFVNIEQHIFELKSLLDSIKKISEIKENQEALIPVGAGVYLKGTIKSKEDAIITVGANVAVKKSMEDVQILVKKQIEEMEKIMIETENQVEAINSHLIDLKNELEKK